MTDRTASFRRLGAYVGKKLLLALLVAAGFVVGISAYWFASELLFGN
jgi:hypothetical protein